MFAVTQYYAEREIEIQRPDGRPDQDWCRCRVLGVTTEDGKPAYIVEYVEGGVTYLETTTYVRRLDKGSPL